MRRLSRLQNNLLTLGAVLGALCLVVALAVVLTGAKPLVFRSGSMAPTIPTGALGVSIPVDANRIRIGDIISVENTAGVRITHRVVKAAVAGDTVTVTLKGDANSVADAAPYALLGADLVIFHAPLVGYAVAWLSSSAAVFAGGLFTAYLLYLAFGAPAQRGSHPQSPRCETRPRAGNRSPGRRSARRLTATSLVSLSVLTGGAFHAAAPSQAAFTDSAWATTPQLTAMQLPSPTLACIQDGNNVQLTLTRSGDLATHYGLTSLANQSWAGSWPAGATVTIAIDVGDAAFNDYSQQTDIPFQAVSKFESWITEPALRYVRYTPSILRLPILGGLIPANLECLP